MLSSYFNNFRYTEDFKKSGKVYIKDTTTTKIQQKDLTQKQSQQYEFITIPNSTSTANNTDDNEGIYVQSQNDKISRNDGKSFAYNLSTINFAALKGIVQNIPKNDQVNNISVNSNGEIINLTPLIDFESLLAQNQLQKTPVRQACKLNRKIKSEKNETEIDMKSSHVQERYDKLPHIKSTQPHKFAYAIKIEESSKNGGGGSAVVVNQLSNVNVPLNNHNNFNTNYNSVQNINVTSNSAVSQTNNVTTNWNFATPANNSLNLINNGSLIGTNNQTMFNQTSNWNLVTTTANITSSNITQTNTSTVTPNIIEQNEKLIQSIQQLPQDNKQNILNGNRNSDVPVVDVQTIKNDPIKIFACDICPKVFKRREHLHQHVKLHTGFRPFGCENCKKTFMRKEHLMRHLTSHTGLKNFTCNICDKAFSRNDNLLKHKKTHEKQTFTCEICQKQFILKHYYIAHKMGHESSEKCQFWNILKT
ncbi:krab domain c2h2 zinc finger [Holotrichia oblita]|uniref:Krab domain c2h2 zinc finger n=1 Tax=Holotrichia oblita TaxID=644536 RepID=A0ACB9SHB2_HOLOL|nr:krab domain c2h2 zinc finger [Holotrichia oblita]